MSIAFDNEKYIPVMEHFYTIQGEGRHQGKAAYFVRLAGCDVGCVWCDVKASWEVDNAQLMLLDVLMEAIKTSNAKTVVITGGEPLMYDLTQLTRLLKNQKLDIHIETSGAYKLSGQLDWITFSPKKFKSPINEIYNLAHELKVIVYNKSDLKWAKQHAEKVNNSCYLYLQPEYSRAKEMLPLIIKFVKDNPAWRISLQVHKYMNIP